jgi:hypothetical protein
VEDNITIFCNDLDIIQHAIKIVVSGDVINDIRMENRLCMSTPCILSYVTVRNKLLLRKKQKQASSDLKPGKICF